jgi:hypothetical protein
MHQWILQKSILAVCTSINNAQWDRWESKLAGCVLDILILPWVALSRQRISGLRRQCFFLSRGSEMTDNLHIFANFVRVLWHIIYLSTWWSVKVRFCSRFPEKAACANSKDTALSFNNWKRGHQIKLARLLFFKAACAHLSSSGKTACALQEQIGSLVHKRKMRLPSTSPQALW